MSLPSKKPSSRRRVKIILQNVDIRQVCLTTGSDIGHSVHFHKGTIERGHIYFFYRPKVELEEAHTLDDVQRFQILLVPRPPEFAQPSENEEKKSQEAGERTLLSPSADAVPAPATTDTFRKPFRLIAVGKKSLPDPEAGGGGKGGGQKQIFWATITTVGEDLHKLEEGLGERSYETKTRGWPPRFGIISYTESVIQVLAIKDRLVLRVEEHTPS